MLFSQVVFFFKKKSCLHLVFPHPAPLHRRAALLALGVRVLLPDVLLHLRSGEGLVAARTQSHVPRAVEGVHAVVGHRDVSLAGKGKK